MAFTPEEKTRIKALWATGSSYTDIAIKLGYDKTKRNAIAGLIHRMGLPKRGGQPSTVRARNSSKEKEKKRKSYRSRPVQHTAPPKPQVRKEQPDALKHTRYDNELIMPTLDRNEELDLHDIPGSLQCHWIYGDVLEKSAVWCRRPVKQGSCFCERHDRITYTPAKAYPKGKKHYQKMHF